MSRVISTVFCFCMLAMSTSGYAGNFVASVFDEFSVNGISPIYVPHYKVYSSDTQSNDGEEGQAPSKETFSGTANGIRLSEFNLTSSGYALGRSVSLFSIEMDDGIHLGAVTANFHLLSKTSMKREGSSPFYGLNVGFGFMADASANSMHPGLTSFTTEIGLEGGVYLNDYVVLSASGSFQDASNGYALRNMVELRMKF